MLALNPLRTIKVLDPRVMISNERTYAILEGGQQVSYKAYTTTSVSSDSIQFSAAPPSPQIIVDRKIYLTLPVRLYFSTNAPVAGKPLLRAGMDGPRAYPIASSISNIAAVLNNSTITMNTSDVIQPLLRYNTGQQLKIGDYSLTPSMLDQAQNYSDLYLSNRSPLQFYSDTVDGVGESRSAFPFTIVFNNENEACVDMVVTEQLMLPPLYWGSGNMGGFIHLQTFDLNINFLAATPYRMWSHDEVSDPASIPGPITGGKFAFANFESIAALAWSYPEAAQPTLNFCYITPRELSSIPRSVTYPYFTIDRYPTPINDIDPGANYSISCGNIQLGSIPRRIYVAVRPDNNVLAANPNTPDVFASIDKISVNWGNSSGLLASATKNQLYCMSLKNHLNQTWVQWSGSAVNSAGVPFVSGGTSNPPVKGVGGLRIGTCGGPLCIEMSTDIGLNSSECPGQLGNYMLQIDIQGKNCNLSKKVKLTAYIIIVSEGIFTLESNQGIAQIGVVSKTDVLTAQQHISDYINYEDIQEVYGGASGNFLTGIKKFGKNLWHSLKPKLQAAYEVGKKALPYASTALNVARFLAAGKGGSYAGGEMEDNNCCNNCRGRGCMQCSNSIQRHGGKMITRDQLRQRMDNI
jgi:hypothetical protein